MIEWLKYTSKELADKALNKYGEAYLEREDVEYIAVVERFPTSLGYQLEFGVFRNGVTTRHEIPEFSKNLLKIPKYFKIKTVSGLFTINETVMERKVYARKKSSKRIKLKRVSVIDDESQSISTKRINNGGSFGAIFQLEGFNDIYFGLSNAHVLYEEQIAPLGSTVYYPRDSNPNTKIIGKTVWRSEKNLDACIFSIADKKMAEALLKIIPIAKNTINPEIGLKVSKKGISSYSNSSVRSDNVVLRFDMNSNDRVLRDQVQFNKFSTNGDSGTVVFSKSKDCVGLIHSIDERVLNTYSYANNITKIFGRSLIGEERVFLLDGKEILIDKLILK